MENGKWKMEKFQNKYRIESHRMPGWDYSGNGYYFITVVTQNRACNLGEINNGEMKLSAFGKIVETQWYQSFEIRNELFLDEFIIMPNHIHAIVVLKKNETNTNDKSGNRNDLNESHVDARPCVYNPINPINRFLCENQNQYHHLLPDLNRPLIQKLMITSMRTI